MTIEPGIVAVRRARNGAKRLKVSGLAQIKLETALKDPWPLERRRKQAAIIRKTKPWLWSTGPRTAAGKARVARNAYQGAQREFFRASAKLLDIFRRFPAAEFHVRPEGGVADVSGCGRLTASERAAIETYARLNPFKTTNEPRVRHRKIYVHSIEQFKRELEQ
jgi:hypothetical protein